MDKIPCNLIKDILPLYVDDAVSRETAEMVKNHLDGCDACREEYEALRTPLALPSNPDLREEERQMLKAMQQKLFWKRFAISAVSVLLTLAVVISGYMVFQEVGPVHDFFDPSQYAINRVVTPGQWQTVSVSTDPYGLHHEEILNFNSIFYNRKVVNDANSQSSILLRVLDSEGNVVIEEFEIQAGEEASLARLQRFTEYRIEMKAEEGPIFLNFH